MINIIGSNNSIFNQIVSEIRDEVIQKDSMRFRRNLERVGEIFAYEISKTLEYHEKNVQTPLGVAKVNVLKEQPVLTTILRAGIPLHQGLLNYFDKAGSAFISAYRKYNSDGTFNIHADYMSCPSIQNKVVFLSDPMLATGSSLVLAYKALLKNGTPKHIHIISVIASKQGIENIKKHLPMENTSLWLGAVDDDLTVKSYIVPGLGDAGDLAYGSKL